MKNKERNDADLDSTFVYTSLDNNDIVKESVTNFEVGDSYHATGLYSTTEGDAATKPEDIDINEKVENEKHEIGNEALSSQIDMESVHPILNEDDKVGDSSPATGVCSVIEGDEVKFTEVEDVDINEKVEKEKQQIGNEESKGKGVKFIENDNVLVDDVPHPMVKCSFEEQKMDSSNECDVVIPDENKAIVQDSVERNVGCSIPDLDDANLVVYNGPDLRSPYEYLPVDVKKPLSDVEKFVADTLFAMIGSKMDLIFESQSGLELNHLEMETLTPTLMASAYVIDAWAELLNILEVYKDESLPLRYFFKITVYIPHSSIGKDKDDENVFIMLHMESYLGVEGEWKCGLAKESKQQDEELNSLRSKFAAKIILSKFNLLRKNFMKLVQEFEQKPKEERKKTIDHAIANRDHRENIEEAPIANNGECENIEEANIPSRNS
ncbi:hypothetical protein Tco_0398046 [Tanacetum coccineum]